MEIGILLLLSIILLIFIFFVNFTRRHLIHRKVMSSVPAARSLPFIGHVHVTKPDVEGFVDQIMGMANLYPDPPRMVAFWAGTIASVMVYSAELVNDVVANSSNLNKGIFYNSLKPWLGNGLLTSSTEKWRPRRKLLTPTFHYEILKNFLHIFNNQSEIFVKQLQKECVKTSVTIPDIGHLVSLCALDIICETSMGQSVDAQIERNSDYVRAVLRINDIIQRRQKNPLMWNDLLFWLFGDGREHKWALNILHSFTKKVILERRSRMLSDRLYGTRLAFLDLLLEMEQNEEISANDIQEEVDTFMFEGHDTTATGITWAILLLGCYPEIQQKVFEEIQTVCGDSVADVTMDQLGQLKYLDCFIKETLRLYPSVPIIARMLGADATIGGCFMPKDTQMLLNIYLIHRDPSHWKDADVFDPDRFLPENSKGRHPFAFVPFSAGSRNCIGQRFAMMEEKVVIVHLLRAFYIRSLKRRDQINHKTELILRPVGGIAVELTLRA